MRECLAMLVLGAMVSGCSASRPPACPPDGGANRTVPAVAGRVFVTIAEVIVGAELVDHERDDQRRACAGAADKNGSDRVGALPTTPSDPPRKALASRVPEHAAGAQQEADTKRPPVSALPAVKAEAVRVRSGRWILVRKTARTLSVFDGDRRVKTYPVVFGKEPLKPKLYEGDGRTPEGEYHVLSKHLHTKWQRFLLLNYPNDENREVYASSRAKGLVPVRGGQAAGTGGSIGIHGTGNDELNRKGIDWTRGCVSLLSRDIQELYDSIPIDTTVVIEQ